VAGIYIREKAGRLPVVTGLGAAVNIAANLAWVPAFGILGAAYATLAAYVVMAAAMFFFSQRIFPIPYEWGRLGRLALIAAGVYAAGTWADNRAIDAFLIGAAFVLLWLGGFFDAEEAAFFRRMFGRRAETPLPETVPAIAEEKDR